MRFSRSGKNTSRASGSSVTSTSSRGRQAPLFEPLEGRQLLSTTFYVSTKGNDANPGTDASHAWRTVQHAMNVATPGSTVNVRAGFYNEKVTVNVSGNAADGFITFQGGGKAIISGLRKAGPNVIHINNQDYVRIVGFDVRDNYGVKDGSGIRLTSGGDHIEIRNNRVYNIFGQSAMGITVYGTDPTRAITNLVIDGNEVTRCTPAPSEALTLNGNVQNFAVTNNYVHQVNGIGIDFIGGEGISPDPATDVVRNGVCSGNRVAGARFRGGVRDAAGIWVDGARNIVIERNSVWGNDTGILVGCVNPALVTSNIKVRDNLLFLNSEAGISVGGTALTGRVQDCQVTNNTLYLNNTMRTREGELRVQFASQILLENNLIVARAGLKIINAEFGSSAITSNYNQMFVIGGARFARFEWGGQPIVGLDAYRAVTAQDANSIFAMPKFIAKPNKLLRVATNSPGANQGNPTVGTSTDGETDIDWQARVQGGRVDIGADEAA